MRVKLPKVKLKSSPCSEYCSSVSAAHRVKCPGCGCNKLVNCQFDRNEAMDIARAHAAKCRALFDLRCTIVPQLTAEQWREGVR